MRLDKWLKVSRLIKRRTVANEACDAGRVSANGRPVKASYDVKPGDVLAWQKYFNNHSIKQPFAQVWKSVVRSETIQKDVTALGAKVDAVEVKPAKK